MIQQAHPMSGGDDLFARTQRIIQAAMAVQKQADGCGYSGGAPFNYSSNNQDSLYSLQAQGNMYASQQMSNMFSAPTPMAVRSSEKTTNNKRKATSSNDKATADKVQSTPQPPKKRAKKVKKQTASAAPKKATPQAPKPVETKSQPQPPKEQAASAAEQDQEDKPKRPLSAYNLFFRYTRAEVLSSDSDSSDDSSEAKTTKPQTPEDKEAAVRKLLADNPYHTDRKKRAHRKSHGKIGFTDLVKLIAARWKGADARTRALFEDLAEEDKLRYKTELEAWKVKESERKADTKDSASAEESSSADDKKSTGKPTQEKKAKKTTAKSSTKKKAALEKALDLATTMPPLPTPVSPCPSTPDVMSDDDLSDHFDMFPMPELSGTSTSTFPLDNDLLDFLTEFDDEI